MEQKDYQGVLRKDLAGVINNNTNCRSDVFKFLASRLMDTAIVQSNNLCPPDTTIAIDRSGFFGNATAVSIPPGIKVCIVDTRMIGNGKGLEVR
jgi:hypothetical protein